MDTHKGFVKKGAEGKRYVIGKVKIWSLPYVDDMFLIAKIPEQLKEMMKQLKSIWRKDSESRKIWNTCLRKSKRKQEEGFLMDSNKSENEKYELHIKETARKKRG